MKTLTTLVFALLLSLAAPTARANGIATLKSWPVWIAAKTCHTLTAYCATKFEVIGDERHKATKSCHNVNRAIDVHGSHACLLAWATCLTTVNFANPVLYCYAYGMHLGKIVNYFNEGKCRWQDHMTHIHIQPLLGCSKQ